MGTKFSFMALKVETSVVEIFFEKASVQTLGDKSKCPYYRGVCFIEVGFIWISVSRGSSELSVMERCPYSKGVCIVEVSVL